MTEVGVQAQAGKEAIRAQDGGRCCVLFLLYVFPLPADNNGVCRIAGRSKAQTMQTTQSRVVGSGRRIGRYWRLRKGTEGGIMK